MWPELLSTHLGFSYRPENNRAAGGATSSRILNQVRSLPALANAASALFVVDVGHQDFLNRSNALDFTNALRTATLNLSNSVVECHRRGGRAVVLMNLWDPNHSPRLARLIVDPILMRARTEQINSSLKTLADQLSAKFPDLGLWRIDLFALFDALVTHSAHYGFTRTDLGALEDPQLTDKSYQGPGRDYMFWDSSHLTSKGHALLAKVFFAALRGSSLGIIPETNGFRVVFDSLQIGKTYHMQQSVSLLHWDECASFCALDSAWEQAVPSSSASGFFRLFCPLGF
jgi:phospholipase/lecithinase/hemolysin